MNGRPDLDRALTGYLEARATSQAPAGLLDVAIAEVRSTGQRPGWMVLSRWISAQSTVRVASAMRVSTRLAFAMLLIAIIVTAVLIAGSQRRLPPPFGPARPGLIASDFNGQLSVMNADGTGRRQLTFGTKSLIRPTWSRDGMSIAYVLGDTPSSNSLVVMSADTLVQVTIADGLAGSDSGLISWSPDSRRLTFAAARAADRTSLSHIYVAEAGRHGAVAIGAPELVGIEPAWSPDGDRIAFKTLGFDQALWLVNADGSNAHRLTHVLGGGYSFWNPQWSSDGTRLLFVAGIDGTYDVWTINADGTDERNISMSKEDEYWPSWSPDGERIAFVRISAEGHGSVVIVNADGSEPVVLPGPSMNSNMPIWSPDGTKLFGPAADTSSPTIVVYDLVHGTPPVSLPHADDGDWQRLAD